jgi:hypothetical protein
MRFAIAIVTITILGCVLFVLWPTEAVPPRTQLLGYDSFRFGMSEDEIRKRITIADRQRTKPGGVSWKATESVRFAGSRFRPYFFLKDGSLARIMLTHFAEVEGKTCKGEIERLVNYLARRHGAPDAPPAKQGQKEAYQATFTFEDGGSIEVVSFTDDTKRMCLDTSYLSGRRWPASRKVSVRQYLPTERPW